MNTKYYEKNYIPLVNWLTEVAEEKIIEHRLLKKKFKSHDEFIIFTIIWLRTYKNIPKFIQDSNAVDSIDNLIKEFYDCSTKKQLGITINAVSRESKIPRTTTKRLIEGLIKKKYITKDHSRLLSPTSMIRNLMKDYRKYNFTSQKKLSTLLNNLNLENFYDKNNF